jgi:hypothetical protein
MCVCVLFYFLLRERERASVAYLLARARVCCFSLSLCVSPPPTSSLLLLHIASSSHHHPCFLLFRSDFLLTTLLHIMMSIIALYIHYSYSTVAMTFIQRIFKKIKKSADLSGHSAYLSFFLLSLYSMSAHTYCSSFSLALYA